MHSTARQDPPASVRIHRAIVITKPSSAPATCPAPAVASSYGGLLCASTVTQARPTVATTICLWAAPDPNRRRRLVARRVDPGDGAAAAVGHPHRAGADGDPGRRVTDRDRRGHDGVAGLIRTSVSSRGFGLPKWRRRRPRSARAVTDRHRVDTPVASNRMTLLATLSAPNRAVAPIAIPTGWQFGSIRRPASSGRRSPRRTSAPD